MAKCNLGDHATCTACGEYVNAERSHLHHYTPRLSKRYATMCRKCSDLILIGAEIILRSVEQYRNATGDPSSLIDLQAQRRIVVGVQDHLDAIYGDIMN